MFAAGAVGGGWWIMPLGALLVLHRSWHAQHDYRQQFSLALADDVLPYATLMSMLQAAATAAGAFAMGRLIGLVLAG
jgi:hypothetical protein